MSPEARKERYKREWDRVSGGMGATWRAYAPCIPRVAAADAMRECRFPVADSTKFLQGDLGILMSVQHLADLSMLTAIWFVFLLLRMWPRLLGHSRTTSALVTVSGEDRMPQLPSFLDHPPAFSRADRCDRQDLLRTRRRGLSLGKSAEAEPFRGKPTIPNPAFRPCLQQSHILTQDSLSQGGVDLEFPWGKSAWLPFLTGHWGPRIEIRTWERVRKAGGPEQQDFQRKIA